jgi:hypothetical protein
MPQRDMTPLERHIRWFIYDFIVRNDRCPTLNEIAPEAKLSPLETEGLLRRLEQDHSAIILSPGSPNIWLADPFAALPTSYPVMVGEHQWYGMCVWDALGILAATKLDGYVPAMCPVSGTKLSLSVEQGALIKNDGLVHFAVPAAHWWRDIGFT